MAESGSISFDRAARYYDQTRSLTPATRSAVADLLERELAGFQPVLEIGVGTGRIALPVTERGLRMVGMDLSRPMLDRLVANAGGRAPLPLVVADATALPLRDGVFGSAFAVHVLHLIRPWRAVAGELVRAVRPGGRVLIDVGMQAGPLRELRDRFSRESGLDRPDVGLADREDLDEAMRAHGAVVRILPAIEDDRELPLGGIIGAYGAGLFSFAWRVEPAVRRRAADAVRTWAAERFGPLDEPRRINESIEWRAYDLAG